MVLCITQCDLLGLTPMQIAIRNGAFDVALLFATACINLHGNNRDTLKRALFPNIAVSLQAVVTALFRFPFPDVPGNAVSIEIAQKRHRTELFQLLLEHSDTSDTLLFHFVIVAAEALEEGNTLICVRLVTFFYYYYYYYYYY